MKVSLREIRGPWDQGLVLDKHSISSQCVGHNAQGHPVFETIRTEVGEATFQLKYRANWGNAKPLAQLVAEHICPKLAQIGFIVPMPASTARVRQPVTAVANELGALLKTPVFEDLLVKAPNGNSLKNLNTKEEKIEAIGDSFRINDKISGNGPWNVLVIDDLFHTGASMEAACRVLRAYPKVQRIYVAALTWR